MILLGSSLTVLGINIALVVLLAVALACILGFTIYFALWNIRRRTRGNTVTYAIGAIYPPSLPKTRRRVSPITAYPQPNRIASQRARELLARRYYDAEKIVSENAVILTEMRETPFRVIGQKLVKGES